jgi:hypothetical protein
LYYSYDSFEGFRRYGIRGRKFERQTRLEFREVMAECLKVVRGEGLEGEKEAWFEGVLSELGLNYDDLKDGDCRLI